MRRAPTITGTDTSTAQDAVPSNSLLPKPGEWLFGGGTMAEAIRQFGWSSTLLGAMDTWPACLRFEIDLMLSCAFPTTIQWGSELILFYNDAYIPVIGDRHPEALGQPILETFPEIIPIYEPMAKRVLTGKRIVLEDQLYRYTRRGGAGRPLV